VLHEISGVLVDGLEEGGGPDVELGTGPRDVPDVLRVSVRDDPGSAALDGAEDRFVPLSKLRERVDDVGDLASAKVSDVLRNDAGELVQEDLELPENTVKRERQ